ncbi:MAG: thioredoxin family protein [Saprospiraceae bacterium]|nr:thioredoxin family protein [Saprospiraceae bacterium]
MRLTILLFFAMCTLPRLQGQGMEFFHGTWAEALEEAKKQDRIIFVDAFAVWCGPCKMMAQNVFPDEKVGAFYNRNFINMKLDMEQGEGLEFRKTYPVAAFPTLFYIDAQGKVVQQVRGAQDVNGFIDLGKKVMAKADRSGEYAAEYDKGNRDPELVLKYVQALNKAGKPSLQISNEYIRGQKDLTTPQNLNFILEAAVVADSKVFDLLVEHRAKIAKLNSEEAVKSRIYQACEATVLKAIEFRNRELLEEAKSKMKKNYAEKSAAFVAKAEMDYSLQAGEVKEYLAAVKAYTGQAPGNQPAELAKVAITISNSFHSDEKAMKQAEGYAKEAAEAGGNYEHYFTYANILARNGKKEEAIKAAEKSLELAKTKGVGASRNVQIFIERLKAGD